MKHWMILTSVGVALVTIFSSAFADVGTDKLERLPPTGEVTVRTAYELRVIGAGHPEVIYALKKKIKQNMRILDQSKCEELELYKDKGKGGPAISIACDRPNAKTDDFFRSLVADASTQKLVDASPHKIVDAPTQAQATSAESVSLTTKTMAAPSYCKFEYCCGITQAELCKRINPTKPCTVCPTYQ